MRNKKEMLDALHTSEIRYRRLFESAKDGILNADTQGRLLMLILF